MFLPASARVVSSEKNQGVSRDLVSCNSKPTAVTGQLSWICSEPGATSSRGATAEEGRSNPLSCRAKRMSELSGAN